ncbi:TIGR04053 family radical SAM/SPASM domain-containing protein [Caldivirga sp.]|uniref:TIGR04053 family radical SAM/SPASM domain-containing protein n=1 Tax=Caldivirga sp. TaxID=2080243 RepID=UPI003D0CC229
MIIRVQCWALSMPLDYSQRPLLVFWETTKACPLSCRHCRANAILKPLPGELTTEEGKRLIEQLTGFGKPTPVLILTGGDPLMRGDIFELIDYAKSLNVPVAVSPTVSERLLNDDVVGELRGVSSVSVSLDGASPITHDYIRNKDGVFELTLKAISRLLKAGVKVQVNTTFMKLNVHELPLIVKVLKDLNVYTWEVFFLIHVGRGTELEALTPEETEDVVNVLYDVSKYGFTVRTVEAPFYRRIILHRYAFESNEINLKPTLGPLYTQLYEGLVKVMGGEPPKLVKKPTIARTRDGDGIIFVAYNGDVSPSGFLPIKLGNVKEEDLVKIYRENPILLRIRRGEYGGRCGSCEFRFICGGSRARAYAEYGDPLAEDPACIYKPGSIKLPESALSP